MSYSQYQQYGGNPYSGGEDGGYGGGGGYGSYGEDRYGGGNPYGGDVEQGYGRPQQNLQPQPSNASQPSQYSGTMSQQPTNMQQAPQQPTSAPMSTADFLARVEAVQNDIRQVGDNISSIGTMHQRLLSSPDQTSTAQLENLVTQTQILNGRIKDTVRFLEADALRSPNDRTKDAQFRSLKTSFKNKLQDYQEEERAYRQRYQDQIARQYRIVNPDATEEEVREAADADWGNEGVFQSALKSNRTGHANSVLGAVRARHNDIQRINKTLEELAQLFEAMNEAVVLQGEQVDQVADAGQKTLEHTEQGNVELTKGVEHARRARKLKWWTLAVVVAIICILALILGLYFGLQNNGNGNGGGNNP